METKNSIDKNTTFKLKEFLQLIRFKNLLMIILVQSIFYLALDLNIDLLSFFLLLQSTVFLAAAGNVINDFFDVKADRINKPNKVLVGNKISGKVVLVLYFILNFFGVISGLVLSYISNKISYGLIFIIISLVLFLYSKSLKRMAFVGNITVSFFIVLSIYLVYIFSSIHFSDFNQNNFKRNVFLTYAGFAFLFTLIREIVKDIEDVNGDIAMKMNTIPILIGRKRTQNLLFYVSFIPFILIILLTSIVNNIILSVYSIVMLILPLSYFTYHIRDVKSKKELHKLSMLLKLIMLFGIFSILILAKII